ncbi:unnamed protein product [Musa acuminata var. zebrina]
MRTAQAIFLISIAERENSSGDLLVSCGRDEKDGRARLSYADPRKKGRGVGGVFIGPFNVNLYFHTLLFTFTFDSAELSSVLLRTSFFAVYTYILIRLITANFPLRFYERVSAFRRKTAFRRKSAFLAQSSDLSSRLRLDSNCILPSASIQTSFKV